MSTSEGVYCHQCGHNLPAHARFCSACGSALAANSPDAHAASPALSDAPPFIAQPLQASANHPNWLKPAAWCAGGLIVLLLLVALVSSGSGNGNAFSNPALTVEDFTALKRQEVLEELNKTGNEFAKHIEQIHLTVTYKRGFVKSISAKTVDGSNHAGPNGSNISEVDMVITAYWDGMLQKEGFTELRVVYDNQAKTVKNVAYLDSNAIFNAATVDWFKVGWTVGAWLAVSM